MDCPLPSNYREKCNCGCEQADKEGTHSNHGPSRARAEGICLRHCYIPTHLNVALLRMLANPSRGVG